MVAGYDQPARARARARLGSAAGGRRPGGAAADRGDRIRHRRSSADGRLRRPARGGDRDGALGRPRRAERAVARLLRRGALSLPHRPRRVRGHPRRAAGAQPHPGCSRPRTLRRPGLGRRDRRRDPQPRGDGRGPQRHRRPRRRRHLHRRRDERRRAQAARRAGVRRQRRGRPGCARRSPTGDARRHRRPRPAAAAGNHRRRDAATDRDRCPGPRAPGRWARRRG